MTKLLINLTQVWGKVDLSDCEKSVFLNFHEFFTRKLKEGSRNFDNSISSLSSPCDGILGEFGEIKDRRLIQAKGRTYTLFDFLGRDDKLCSYFPIGSKFVTLRIKPNFYHRVHSPGKLKPESYNFIPGELWNVNKVTLDRIDNLFCKNERLIIKLHDSQEKPLAICFVGSVLVGSIFCSIVDKTFDSVSQQQSSYIDRKAFLNAGDEIGMFHYGSTIIMILDGSYQLTLNHSDKGNFIKAGQVIGKKL